MIIAELIESYEEAKIWMDYLKELLKWMGTEDMNNVVAGLTSLIIIIEKADDSIYPLTPKILKMLFQIFTKPEVW